MSFPRLLLLLVLSAVTVTAQPPSPVAPPAVPMPGMPTPGTPGGGPPSSLPAGELPEIKPGIPLGENKIEVPIVEPKLSGSALATVYRRYTGRRVIVSNAAATAEFSFVQEASAKDPLTFAEAAELLKKAATIENFVFVPHPNDPKIDVLTLATGGIRPQDYRCRVECCGVVQSGNVEPPFIPPFVFELLLFFLS